ncbi:hypothetical protein BGW80DRAFT_1457477 [Lactifluus volemus]|nr:hypothetical protein BGW80DRAFT_1457477 [Lactifluus volemus]
MAPPPVPPAKKLHRFRLVSEVAKTPVKEQDISSSGLGSSPLVPKPSSTAGSITPSLKGTEAQGDSCDDVSVAESSKYHHHRKTDEERLQFFRSQPECREVEPHRAFCTGCNQWVPLNPSRAYVMRPWLVHRRDCRRNSLTIKQYALTPGYCAPSDPPLRRVITDSPSKDGAPPEGSEADDEVGSVRQSISDKSGRFKGEADRQAYLEGDPRAEEVRPYEVLCKTCKNPSSRVATAERKLKLVNDACAKSFTTTSVLCKHCDATIALDGEGDYNVTKWDEHKTNCPSLIQSEQAAAHTDSTPVTTSDASPSRSEKSEDRPPLSAASTEATAVDTVGSSSTSKKRPRESDEDESENRPHTRARTDVSHPSGALDWLLLPFRSFVSGFRKGMGQSPSSPSVESTSPT